MGRGESPSLPFKKLRYEREVSTMMNAKSYNVNTREGEIPSFDLEAEEFVVTVLKTNKDCTVIDNEHKHMYMVQAETMKAAVVAYVDWL